MVSLLRHEAETRGRLDGFGQFGLILFQKPLILVSKLIFLVQKVNSLRIVEDGGHARSHDLRVVEQKLDKLAKIHSLPPAANRSAERIPQDVAYRFRAFEGGRGDLWIGHGERFLFTKPRLALIMALAPGRAARTRARPGIVLRRAVFNHHLFSPNSASEYKRPFTQTRGPSTSSRGVDRSPPAITFRELGLQPADATHPHKRRAAVEHRFAQYPRAGPPSGNRIRAAGGFRARGFSAR